MAESNSPRRAKPELNTIQSISYLNRFQRSKELLAHPERWIETAERHPQPPPHIRHTSPTCASSRSTLPPPLASDASQRNRNRNRIRDENSTRDLIRGRPQSRTQAQAHDPTRHLLREPLPPRTRDRSPSHQQKQAATTKHAPPIATPPPPPPPTPIENGIPTAPPPPEPDSAVPLGVVAPSPDHRAFIPIPLFRASVPQPPPPQLNRRREEQPQTHTAETSKPSHRGGRSYTPPQLRTFTTQMKGRADRRDGRQARMGGEDGREGSRAGGAQGPGGGWERGRGAGAGAAFTESAGEAAVGRREKTAAAGEGAGVESGGLEVGGGEGGSAAEERPVAKRSGKGVEVAERAGRMEMNMDRRMRGLAGLGIEIAVEEAVEDAEWVLVTAPAPAANPQDVGGEEVEIEVETEGEAEWCVVRN